MWITVLVGMENDTHGFDFIGSWLSTEAWEEILVNCGGISLISLLILTGHQPQMAIRLIADVMNYTGFTVTVWSQSEDTAVNTGQLIIITAHYYGCQVSRKVLQMKTETCADKHLMALISLNWGQCSGIINEARFSFTAVAFVWEDWGHAWR